MFLESPLSKTARWCRALWNHLTELPQTAEDPVCLLVLSPVVPTAGVG